MAIDTRNKRSSAINPQCPWRGMWPEPDATVGQPDRQHVLWSYAGIAAGSNAFTPTETYCVEAAQAYTAGASRADWITGYAVIGGSYTAGGNRTQGEC